MPVRLAGRFVLLMSPIRDIGGMLALLYCRMRFQMRVSCKRTIPVYHHSVSPGTYRSTFCRHLYPIRYVNESGGNLMIFIVYLIRCFGFPPASPAFSSMGRRTLIGINVYLNLKVLIPEISMQIIDLRIQNMPYVLRTEGFVYFQNNAFVVEVLDFTY